MTTWRQLDLLKARNQRGTKAPRASEFALHCAIMDTLRISRAPGWIVFHPANGELRETGAGARLKRMGVMPGVSDIVLVGPPAGRFHALEIKVKGNRPTEAQAAFLEAVRAAGGLAEWVDGYREALAILKGWGAVRTSLKVTA